MKSQVPTAAVLLLLIACTSENTRRSGDTGMAEGAPGGISSRDTMPSATGDAGVGGNGEATPAGVLSQMNVANTTEIQLSTLATKKASSPQVKQIARKLVADHTKNREEVQALAQKVSVTFTCVGVTTAA